MPIVGRCQRPSFHEHADAQRNEFRAQRSRRPTCPQRKLAYVVQYYCDWWNQFPGLGIAGFEGSTHHGWLQVKTSPGEEEATLAAAKQAVIQRYPRGFNEENLTIIPVKYSLEELWCWRLVLTRFAESPGNTLASLTCGLDGTFWGQAMS